MATKDRNKEQELTQPIKVDTGETALAASSEIVSGHIDGGEAMKQPPGSPARRVTLQRTENVETPDQLLWIVIRNRTNAIQFSRYQKYLDGVKLDDPKGPESTVFRIPGVEAYEYLKLSTRAFLMQEVGVGGKRGDTLYNLVPKDLTPAQHGRAMRRLHADEEARVGAPVDLQAMRSKYLADVNLRAMRSKYLDDLEREFKVIPYFKIIRERLEDLPIKIENETPLGNYGILSSKVTAPILIELIWNYWMEQGMMVQTLNAVTWRFQNRRFRGMNTRPPLSNLEIDPLRPLSNAIWGYIQDEPNRLSVARRAYEYEHEYGLKLYGPAVQNVEAADSRPRFLEAFHTLLYHTSVFYKQDDDTTKIADAFPLINILKEMHLIMAAGAHNQFGDLPWTSRSEMMIQQWLLARPEMREFLGGRIMVPYPEPWMDRVDMVNTLMGWNTSSIMHFRDLAIFGEQILLSVRYGNWSDVNDQQQAKNWARYWRPEIQAYIHAYRAVTGVSLTADNMDITLSSDRYRQPSDHLRERAHKQGN
jgi:hypothetical protein